MPETKKQGMLFNTISCILMCLAMVAFNKFRFTGEFSPDYFRQTGLAFLQKFPVAWLYQYFVAQPYAAKKAGSPQEKSRLEYTVLRIKYTVIASCPPMSLFSCAIVALERHLSLYQMINMWIPSMCVNAVFAFFIQFLIVNRVSVVIFNLFCTRNKTCN